MAGEQRRFHSGRYVVRVTQADSMIGSFTLPWPVHLCPERLGAIIVAKELGMRTT